jgi:hypothetical protein
MGPLTFRLPAAEQRLGGPNDATMEVVPQETRPGVLAHLESILVDGNGGAQLHLSATALQILVLKV